jgi:hypothetical protein
MRYWLFMLGGLAVAGVSVVLFDSGLFHLVRTPTCGTTGTYVSRPCPPGTAGHILSLIGGIFGGLIGIGLFAARGRKGSLTGSIGIGVIMWSLLFVTAAGSIAYSAYGPGNRDSSAAKTTSIILGVIFLPLGLAPLPFAIGGRRKAQQFVQLSTTGFPTSGVPGFGAPPYVRPPTPRPPTPAAPAQEDPLEKIARLGQLRDRGLLTPEEFEAQKKRLLGEV